MDNPTSIGVHLGSLPARLRCSGRLCIPSTPTKCAHATIHFRLPQILLLRLLKNLRNAVGILNVPTGEFFGGL